MLVNLKNRTPQTSADYPPGFRFFSELQTGVQQYLSSTTHTHTHTHTKTHPAFLYDLSAKNRNQNSPTRKTQKPELPDRTTHKPSLYLLFSPACSLHHLHSLLLLLVQNPQRSIELPSKQSSKTQTAGLKNPHTHTHTHTQQKLTPV